MKALPKRTFMHFVVALVEQGDTEAMTALLDAHPEHRSELLFGCRTGVDHGCYSAWSYSTWLCHFDAYREAGRRVVEWLRQQGHPPDLWSALALEDLRSLQTVLEQNPELARAKHPIFGDSALELGSSTTRPLLLTHGADDGTVFTALLLGQLDRARAILDQDRSLLDDSETGPKVLLAALTNGHDRFACELIAAGVELTPPDDVCLLSMAATWGNPEATAALLDADLDPNRRSGKFTPLSMCISRSVSPPDVVAEVVAALLAGGAEVRRTRIDGLTLLQWCKKKNLADVAKLIRGKA